ncbi:MAG: hypothetical protein AAF411_20690, partial [Myxococcota bacterium]
CSFEPNGACESNECNSPGMIETVACGSCGTTDRFCSAAGVWEFGECSEPAGACVPGTEVTESCGMCGTRTQRCNTECALEEAACEDEGVCEPGSLLTTSEGCSAGQTRVLQCTDGCEYEELEPCTDDVVACEPSCAAGETCRADGVCLCGFGPACRAGEQCISGLCEDDEPVFTDCSIVPDRGCPSGQTCLPTGREARTCRDIGRVREGEDCAANTDCRAGLVCVGGTAPVCRRFCETSDDCIDGSFCERSLLIDGQPVAGVCSIRCNPLNNVGCGAGLACRPAVGTLDDYVDCWEGRGLFFDDDCEASDMCPITQGCSTEIWGIFGGSCGSYCRVGEGDCAVGTCTGFANVDGVQYGICEL